MITIIHGDDVSSSRKYFQDKKQKSANQTTFDGQFELEEFIQVAQGGGLFASDKKIYIENFFSKNKANSSLIKNVLDYVSNNSSSLDLILWEGKELQKKHLNLFDAPIVKTFMIPKTIFLFLESIAPGNYKRSIYIFHKALQNTEPEIIFFMIQRQLRMLLALKDKNSKSSIDEISRLASWQKGKLERQARLFSTEKLLNLHDRIYQIEVKQKTGNLAYSLDKSIDFFLLGI